MDIATQTKHGITNTDGEREFIKMLLELHQKEGWKESEIQKLWEAFGRKSSFKEFVLTLTK